MRLQLDVFGAKPKAVSVHGPHHASHLHSGLHVEKILRLDDARVQRALRNSRTRHLVMSPSTGIWYTEETSASLIQAIVHDILTEPLRLGRILDGCVLKVQSLQCRRCHVIPIGKCASGMVLQKSTYNFQDLQMLPLA